MTTKSILIVMGSESDLSSMKPAAVILEELSISFTVAVASAHRTPDRAAALAAQARADGVGAIIAGAGMAHHLGGALAARTTIPVIAVPLASGAMQGVDALISAVQMPPGVPVAVVAIGGAKNAAFLAAQILAVHDEALAAKLDSHRVDQATVVNGADARLKAALEVPK